MTSYEKLIKMMNSKAQECAFFVVQMESASTCKVNDLPLSKSDLLINDYLMQDGTKPLKKGDIVILAKVSDEKYVILCRAVEL